ncbi:hypothetical protein [uncultured Formosa sp.]|uniref:hypothetical protein n=1 Tax=uncultured Formosa sp. TaxID=255435 RepID=UPI00260AE3FB|nr:hypothetical protein [uncultured Formosa sp.]
MKYFTILVTIILCTACGITKNSAVTAQNDVLIEYKAITRGYFLEIKIENQEILVKTQQQGPDKIITISKTEWDILMDKLHAIDLKTLPTLEAPSMKRAHDGAASARLKIIEEDTVYSTTEFDHENPNKKIKPLVEYILSLSKKVE